MFSINVYIFYSSIAVTLSSLQLNTGVYEADSATNRAVRYTEKEYIYIYIYMGE